MGLFFPIFLNKTRWRRGAVSFSRMDRSLVDKSEGESSVCSQLELQATRPLQCFSSGQGGHKVAVDLLLRSAVSFAEV